MHVRADDVTITFTNMAGVQWRRTGNREPVRVAQSVQQSWRSLYRRLDLTGSSVRDD